MVMGKGDFVSCLIVLNYSNWATLQITTQHKYKNYKPGRAKSFDLLLRERVDEVR
jgi:hypothetical protein